MRPRPITEPIPVPRPVRVPLRRIGQVADTTAEGVRRQGSGSPTARGRRRSRAARTVDAALALNPEGSAMPMRPPRICACGYRIAHGSACPCEDRRARERKARHDQARPSARERGYDTGWQRAARAFLAEPGHDRCECGAPAVLVRHVVSVRRRPDLRMDRSNWMPGCVRCNARDHAREQREAPGVGLQFRNETGNRRWVSRARLHKFGVSE